MSNKHSKPFFEVTTRLYIPLDADLHKLSQLHGIDFLDLLKKSEVINIHRNRKAQEGKPNAS